MKQLLGHTDSLQLFPLAYPWAWDMYLENMDNHRTPRKIWSAPVPVSTRLAVSIVRPAGTSLAVRIGRQAAFEISVPCRAEFRI